MPYLTVVGTDLNNCRDQAKLIMGDRIPIDSGHRENVDYFQFNTEAPVVSPTHGFQAGIQGNTVCVLWVLYHP
jgi:hypothetical protein